MMFSDVDRFMQKLVRATGMSTPNAPMKSTSTHFRLDFRLYVHDSEQIFHRFVCVEVLRPSQPNGVMSSAVSLPNHTFTGQA